ncbi:MAG: thioredoxin family protein [Bacteroidales bacterium]|nr:thioredoxin family protein [Bacteroidales bacterium]
MKKALISIYLMLLCMVSMAQENVTWKYSANTLKNGDVELMFDATIVPGYHLYSPYNPAGASMPLSITFNDSDAFSTDGVIKELTKYEEHYEEVFDATERFYNGSAKFSIVIKPKTTEPFSVTGKIKGQACNDAYMCTMVRDDFSIPVIPAQTKASEKKNDSPKVAQEPKAEMPSASAPEKSAQASAPDTEADTEAAAKAEAAPDTAPDTTASAASAPEIPATTQPESAAQAPDGGSLWTTFLLAFLAGLAAIFTPCVFPMIPMTVSYFLKDKSGRGKLNAIIYGISIVALYTLPVAVLILISNLVGGESFTAGIFNALSTHWLPNIIFFVVFMIFAMSFLGMFEITMPSSIINKAEQRGDKGGLIGIFFLAFVLVLVSFSCTGPIVGSVLVESASGNNFLKPIIAILGFSIAFALPFTLFAFFPEIMKKMPKSGGWMNTMKVILGFVELALGLKFLSVADQTYHWHILDRETYLCIWIAIGLMLTLYLLGKIKLPLDDDMPHLKVPRLMLAIISLSFTVYMIPGLWGAPLRALSGYIPPITTQDFVMGANIKSAEAASNTDAASTLCGTPKYSDILKLPHGMVSYFDYSEAISCAKAKGKPVLLIFTGHGCVNCRKMEENVWSDPRVRQKMQQDFVMCSLFTDDRTLSANGEKTIGEVNTELQISKFQINAQPYYVILDAETEEPITEPQGYNPDVESFLQYLGKNQTQK